MWNNIDKKMELLMMRADIKDEPRKIIDRFFNGLDTNITNRVELLPYKDLT